MQVKLSILKVATAYRDCAIVDSMKRIVLSLVGILAVLVITAGLSGCYIAKQGYYFYTYQQQAEPITEVLENDELSPEIRSLLENAVEIKQF